MKLTIDPEKTLETIKNCSGGPLLGLFDEICKQVAGKPFDEIDEIDPLKIHISYTFYEKLWALIRAQPDGTKRPIRGEDIVMVMKYFPGIYHNLQESEIEVEQGAITVKGETLPWA